jgi:hypothetical protein
MTLALSDLLAPMSRLEVETVIYNTFSALGASTSSWKPGAVVRTLISAVSVVASGCTVIISEVAKGAYLDTAEDEFLRVKAEYDYGIDPALISEEVYGIGYVDVVNSGGGVYSWDAGDVFCSNSTTNKSYKTVAAVSIGALETVTDIQIQAVEAGSGSNAYAGEIDTLYPAASGVTVSNPDSFVVSDPLSAPQIRQLCRDKLSSLSPNGPPDAYRYFATLTTLAGVSVGVTRVRTKRTSLALKVYVATAAGGVSGDQYDPETPLGAVRDQLVRNCVPIGVDINVLSAGQQTVNITYTAWLYSDSPLTDAEFKLAVLNNLGTLFSDSPIGGYLADGVGSGGYLFADAITDAIRNSAITDSVRNTTDCLRAIRDAGHADISITEGYVPVLGTVTGTVIRQERDGRW